MSDTAICVENLGKRYQLGAAKSGSFRESMSSLFRRNGFPSHSAGNLTPNTPSHPESNPNPNAFWALNDINFEIKRGEAVGIIGRNGAGKSTLLKILSRITEPTKGRFEIFGRVSSLLEVGTGFHPELTGRENVYLNGTILGMKRREVKAKFDEIVAFSGVEKFIDTSVKHYSSGMQVRLAFAVAAHLEPEILIIDEVLAVGDAEFQKKCLGKMEDVTGEGRTVLFVSHDMNAIQRLCSHGILLKAGGVEKDGFSTEVVDYYLSRVDGKGQNAWNQNKKLPRPHFRHISVYVEGKQPDLVLKIIFSVQSQQEYSPAIVAFDIVTSRGVVIMQALPEPSPFISYTNAEQFYECEIKLPGIVPDNYKVSAWIGAHNSQTYDLKNEVVGFEVLESPITGRTFPHTPDHGFLVPKSDIKHLEFEKSY